MKTPPFVEGAGPFLPTTPLTEEEATRLYKKHKRQATGVAGAVESGLDRLDAGLVKQLQTSEQLKRNKELGEKFTPVELALGGAGPPSKEAVKEAAGYAGEAAKFAVGETPTEWAASALMGPGKLPAKLARAAVAGSLHTPEAEGVLLNLGVRQPSRWDRLLRQAERLKGEGRSGEELFRATGGRMTIGPEGNFEGIYRPRDVKLGRISDRTTFLKNVWDDPELFQDVPGLHGVGVRYGRKGEDFPEGSKIGAFYRHPKASGGDMGSIIINPESQSVQNARDFRGLLGHEIGHGVSHHTGDIRRFGAEAGKKREELATAQKLLPDVFQYIADPVERERMLRLSQRLRKVDPKDLYYRDIGEAHGRASQAAVLQDKADPYSHHLNATKFGLERPTFEKEPYQRLITPSSALESGDMGEYLKHLQRIMVTPK